MRLGLFIFIVSLIFSYWYSSLSSWRLAAQEVCTLVSKHYYRSEDPVVTEHIAKCFAQARYGIFWGFSRSTYIDQLNRLLDPFLTSHLSIYSPVEHTQVWQHESVDTGIRARLIDAHYVVHTVLPKSPAEEAGVRVGDDIIAIDNFEITTLAQLTNSSGTYTIMRRVPGDQTAIRHIMDIKARTYQEDRAPRISRLDSSTGYLKLASFLPQYFEKEAWKLVASQLQGYERLIVDLRENQGGSFPAMLRALSPFRCQSPDVGTLQRGLNRGLAGAEALGDDLDDNVQLGVLDRQRTTVLRTFGDYPCFPGPVAVLTDPGTASVAELFAAAFLTRPKSTVLGQSTAGQLVMAQWFPLTSINEFSMSIPIASVWTDQNVEIEARGVYPQIDLYYELEAALEGRDNWLAAAILHISKEKAARFTAHQ